MTQNYRAAPPLRNPDRLAVHMGNVPPAGLRFERHTPRMSTGERVSMVLTLLMLAGIGAVWVIEAFWRAG